MKKRFLLTLVSILTIGSMAMADIQSSPGAKWNWSRKLSRGLANVIYGPVEILTTWNRSNRADGSSTAAVEGPIEGLKRSLVRVGYGVFEIVTFPAPAYKGTYRPPYYRKERIDPWKGYDEFPPQLGIQTQAGYTRTQVW
jgi:putative exosortase-associated protein (TIGR04073 family)